MHIRKYDFNYGRRELMKKVAMGAGAGVLMPLSKVLANEMPVGKAYPDELMSIEMATKGQLKPGDMLTAENVEHAKELLEPTIYHQVKNLGRRIKLKETVTDLRKMYTHEAYEALLRNQKEGITAKFDDRGNVVTQSGEKWVAGTPFPDAKKGDEVQANMAISWGRADYNQYAIRDIVLSPDGGVAYDYEFVWAELQVQARNDGRVFRGLDDMLRLQTVFFTSTQDVAGSSFLSNWYYDQNRFPELYGYLPQFRRVRQFPTNQRFEPLIPGVTWFLTDPWGAGDPMRTWGEFKILERKPMLVATNTTWAGKDPNWNLPRSGGPSGDQFFEVEYELSPEVIVLESKPVKYTRAPVGRRLCYVDARNYVQGSNVRYDRTDKPWVNFEAGFAQYDQDGVMQTGQDGKHPAWSWTYVQSHDVQSGFIDLASHQKTCAGGYESVFEAGADEVMYDKFFTQQALQRLGQI